MWRNSYRVSISQESNPHNLVLKPCLQGFFMPGKQEKTVVPVVFLLFRIREDESDKIIYYPEKNLMQLKKIQSIIYEIRGQKVMLDFDLARLYGTETRSLKQAVKRNRLRFPKDFMFILTKKEWQEVITNCDNLDDSIKYSPSLPFAFTEHGVTMLASVLRSGKAVQMNIAIVRAFISLKEFALNYQELAHEIKALKKITGNHNGRLNQIYVVLENLLDEKVKQKKWEDRDRIGFRK
jgi:hypothetical protein